MEGVLLGRTLLGCSRGNRWQALRLGHPGPTFEEERHLRCEPLQLSPAQSLITVESQGSVAVRSVARGADCLGSSTPWLVALGRVLTVSYLHGHLCEMEIIQCLHLIFIFNEVLRNVKHLEHGTAHNN